MCLTLLSSPTSAGIYTDDLSRCLVEKTTTEDKEVFVRWMYVALSLHPAVQGDLSIEKGAIDSANKTMADLMTEMLTVRCLETAQKAVKYEGAVSIQAAFQVFGQVAGAELMGNTKVAEGLGGIEKYFDQEAMNSEQCSYFLEQVSRGGLCKPSDLLFITCVYTWNFFTAITANDSAKQLLLGSTNARALFSLSFML